MAGEECLNCGWQGSAAQLDAGVCPQCGGDCADPSLIYAEEPEGWGAKAFDSAVSAYGEYMGLPEESDTTAARIAAGKAIEQAALRTTQADNAALAGEEALRAFCNKCGWQGSSSEATMHRRKDGTTCPYEAVLRQPAPDNARLLRALEQARERFSNIAINCQGASVCEGDPGGGHEHNFGVCSEAINEIDTALASTDSGSKGSPDG